MGEQTRPQQRGSDEQLNRASHTAPRDDSLTPDTASCPFGQIFDPPWERVPTSLATRGFAHPPWGRNSSVSYSHQYEKSSGYLAAIQQVSTDRGEPASPSREQGTTESTAAQRNTDADRLYECLDCGAVTTAFSTDCSECGATAFRTNIVGDEQKSPSVFQAVSRPLERLGARYNPYIPR